MMYKVIACVAKCINLISLKFMTLHKRKNAESGSMRRCSLDTVDCSTQASASVVATHVVEAS